MANKTADKILNRFRIASWAALKLKDDDATDAAYDKAKNEASRQLYEATMEIIGEKQGGDCVFEAEADTRQCKWCGNLASDRVHRYAYQLAKARAFYGIAETEEEASNGY